MPSRLLSQVPPIYNPAVNSNIGDVQPYSGNSIPILELFLRNVVTMAFIIAGLWFFIQIILSGYNYITAAGDKESVQKAQRRIQQALIGLVIILALYALNHTINIVFGLNIISFNIPRP